MCGSALEDVLDFYGQHGLSQLDAKTGLDGEPVETMTESTAREFAARVAARGMQTYTLSTSLFAVPSDDDEAIRRESERLIALRPVIDAIAPRYVRVLAPTGPAVASAAVRALAASADAISRSGAELLIENGPQDSVVSSPADAATFFAALGQASSAIGMIWDVQNMWQCGWFPRGDELDTLGDAVRYVHVKGGRADDGRSGGPLVWASALTEASWPVERLIERILEAPHVEAVALNPSHGRLRAGETPEDIRDTDIEFLKCRLTPSECDLSEGRP